MKHTVILSLTLVALLLSSCNNRFSHPDVSGIELSIEPKPFYRDLLRKDENAEEKSKKLLEKYGDYFRTYCRYEIRVGDPCDSLHHDQFLDYFGRFTTIEENTEVLKACDSVFGAQKSLATDLSDAFKCFRYYFPDKGTPDVLLHFSGFNNKMFVDSTYLSLSLEHYLGADCPYYSMLEIPMYAQRTKDPAYIVPDLVKAWLLANFPDESPKSDVLSALVYNGKILYAQKMCLPDLSDAMLFGFSDEQLDWCRKNEGNMWRALIDQQLLYSTSMLDRNKLVNETPFTTFFGQESPGRAALYCAFNIVCDYTERNPDITLAELLTDGDAQKVLVGAHYTP